jgi:hypothetical protein
MKYVFGKKVNMKLPVFLHNINVRQMNKILLPTYNNSWVVYTHANTWSICEICTEFLALTLTFRLIEPRLTVWVSVMLSHPSLNLPVSPPLIQQKLKQSRSSLQYHWLSDAND